MKINGKTITCGLIGNPVEHTLSPVIHNNLAEKLGTNLVYVPFLVESGELEAAIKGGHALHIRGMNVTVPHKSAVIPYLCGIDPLAESIGAVNTLVYQEDGYKGYNTDMSGLFRAMQTEGIGIKGENVLLLGAGGAARAVAYLCATAGAKKIYLCNRTLQKAEEIAGEIRMQAEGAQIAALSYEEIEGLTETSFLAIQCTSVGLYPNVSDVVLADGPVYDRIHTGVDLIYRPYETQFMKLVKAHGGKTMNGLKMLLYQGIIAYELWNQCDVPEEQADDILQMMKEEMGIYE
nr:shikimate dehydrogenase [Lachnospiraceae bacterium]